jgi:hypothetical protein
MVMVKTDLRGMQLEGLTGFDWFKIGSKWQMFINMVMNLRAP